MKSYILHYYDWSGLQEDDFEIFEALARTVDVAYEATGQKKVNFDPKRFRQEGDFIISNDENRLHFCLSTEEVIDVPEGVKSIASSAIYEEFCPNAKRIELSSTVDGISPLAIVGHTVEQLTIRNKYIYISDHAFDMCPSLREIHHIPGGATVYTEPDRWQRARPYRYEPLESREPENCGDPDDDIDLPF